MGFSLDESLLISDAASTTDYRIAEPIQKVLRTLPEQEDVPKAIVMLGILTEQLEPVDGDLENQIRIVNQNVGEAPPAAVPEQTINGIEWLLYQLRGTLSQARKQQIGRLLQQSELADVATQSEARSSAGAEDTAGESTSDDAVAETDDKSDDPERTNPTDEVESGRSSSNDETTTQDANGRQTKYSTTAENGLSESANADATTTATGEAATHHCEFCEEGFPSESALVSHTVQCTQRPDDAKYRCPTCGNKYVSETALKNHREDCDRAVESESDAQERGSTSHTCEHCGSEFTEMQTWLDHEQGCQESRSSTSTGRLNQTDATSGQLVAEAITGHVAEYKPEEGYGFILTFNLSDPDQSNSIFFHVSEYPGKPQSNAKLRFDIRETEDGLKAEAISHEQSTVPETKDETFASERTRWGE
jgi:cold shock CspA family protein/DNA-directed RNA polymerase subunit RPC12/RpoP